MSDMQPVDWTPDVDDTRDSWRRELKVGGAIAAAFFIGLIGFAAVIPLDAGAYAEGVVAVSGNRQAVQHDRGGIVTALSVTEGQTVEKGQPLLEISASEALATERGLAGQVVALLAERSRLLAEQSGLGSIQEPVEFQSLPAKDREMAAEAMELQRRLFAARRDALATQRSVLGSRISQQSQQSSATRYQIESNREQKRLISEELEGLQELRERGFVSLNRLREMERASAQLDGNFGAYQADIARYGEAIGETRLQISSLQKNQMEEVAVRLREVRTLLDELQPRLAAMREQLSRSVVRAPASGRVVGLNIFTVGGVVSGGQILMEIVPQDRNLIIEAKASPIDADDIHSGMETQVRFSAIQERSLPILAGTVSKVSADSLEDERTGMRYFAVEIVVPPSELAKIKAVRADGGLRAGLPAEVIIPLRKRSALTYLVEPLTQTLWRAGREN